MGQNLKQPGAVLLISCYELGHQPLGVALPHALLHERGYHPAVLDLAVQALDPEAVRRARVVAFAAPMHTALRIGIQAAREVRDLNPPCHIVFFGLYAGLNQERLLAGIADSCLPGTDDAALVNLLVSLEGDEYAGSASGSFEHKRLPRLPTVPPRRRGLPGLEQYARLQHVGEERLAGYVEASRGCLHKCRHCPIPAVYGGRFVAFAQETVLEDIRQQVEAGACHITFGDPDFLNGPGHSLEIVRELHRRHPGVTFDCTIKIEHIVARPEIFPALAACGCLFVVSAVESLSERVLGVLRKGHTRSNVRTALEILRTAGISMRPTWVPFTPWTNLDDILDLFVFVEDEDLADQVDPVQYSVRLLLPPGSLLLQEEEMRPFPGSLDSEAISYEWTHPDPRMDALQGRFAKMAQEHASERRDPQETFYRMWDAAAEQAGHEKPLRKPRPADRLRPPRLTEDWFC